MLQGKPGAGGKAMPRLVAIVGAGVSGLGCAPSWFRRPGATRCRQAIRSIAVGRFGPRPSKSARIGPQREETAG